MIVKPDPVRRELAYNSVQRARSPQGWDGRPCLEWSVDELEAEAIELRIVAGELFPPLLQHQAYAGAVHVVLSEAALRRAVGGAQVMTDQLLWLLQLCGMESVTVQVVPNALGAFPGQGWSFTCLSFLERQFEDVVAVELPHGTTWLEQEAERLPYEHTFLKLQEMALPRAESAELVAELVEALS